MKMTERAARLIAGSMILAMFALAIGACQTPAGRTGGEVVDDATITTKVKSKLLEDSLLRGVAVSVETFEGNVTLTGAVDSDVQKSRAEDLAKNTNGVKKVNNLILIKKK